MKKIVVKFGGSNLKSESDFQKLVATIKAYNRPLVVVISAFYGVTNLLSNLLVNIKNDEEHIYEFSDFFMNLQKEIINVNITNDVIRKEVLGDVEERIHDLNKYLLGIHYIGDTPDYLEDTVLSYGEKLSSLVLSAILRSNGIESKEVTPEKMRLVTDGEFGNATVDIEGSEKTVQEQLSGNIVYVVPGFYGVSAEGRVTLLGRGGTDYSAAAIANCINAESLDIWKDVDGFMSADPKVVSGVKKIAHLNYTEAAELAYFGAKILHPRTVEPLVSKNIPIRLYNIDACDSQICPQTIIDNNTSKEFALKSVTASNEFGIVKLRGSGVGIKPGVLALITKALSRNNINIRSVITSQVAINLLLSRNYIAKAQKIIKKLQIKAIHEVIVMQNITTIAVVGDGLLDNYGIAARMFGAVANKQINILLGTVGASQVSCYLIVNEEHKNTAITEIHNTFFGESITTHEY